MREVAVVTAEVAAVGEVEPGGEGGYGGAAIFLCYTGTIGNRRLEKTQQCKVTYNFRHLLCRQIYQPFFYIIYCTRISKRIKHTLTRWTNNRDTSMFIQTSDNLKL